MDLMVSLTLSWIGRAWHISHKNLIRKAEKKGQQNIKMECKIKLVAEEINMSYYETAGRSQQLYSRHSFRQNN